MGITRCTIEPLKKVGGGEAGGGERGGKNDEILLTKEKVIYAMGGYEI